MIELRSKNSLIFAVSDERIFPGCEMTEDGKRVLGQVLWDNSMDANTFWRVYGDGVMETIEKVNGEWQFLGNAHYIPENIQIIAIDSEEDKSYNAEVIQCAA